jgi:two-component system sensor histidine kinase AtoS
LDLARVPQYRFEMTNIKTLLQQTLDVIGEEILANHIHCQCAIENSIPTVRADASQLSKAFHNLLKNAVQAMPTGGNLVITARCQPKNPYEENQTIGPNNMLTLVIQDTGPGIPPQDIKNIFNPFFTTKDKGTGLGLAITHKVIAEHNGHIEVRSRPGDGSQFIISLPT